MGGGQVRGSERWNDPECRKNMIGKRGKGSGEAGEKLLGGAGEITSVAKGMKEGGRGPTGRVRAPIRSGPREELLHGDSTHRFRGQMS